jgi:PAS domain S-box-containing protein
VSLTQVNQHKNGDNKDKSVIQKQPLEPVSKKRTTPYPLNRLLWGAGFIFVIGVLFVFSAVSHRSGVRLQEATQAVAHTHEVLEKLDGVSAGLSAVESSARSFAIAGKQSHLDPFYSAIKTVPQAVDDLKVLLQNDTNQLQAVLKIEPVIDQHLQIMKHMVELGDKNLFKEMFRGFSERDLTDEGNTLMEQIQAALDPIEKQQRARLSEQQAALVIKAEHLTIMDLTGSIFSTMLVLACGIFAFRALHDREKAELKLDRLLGSMPDALVIINAEGKIVSSNAHTEKLFGYSERELQGERMALLVPERLRQVQRQYYTNHFSQRANRALTTTIELYGLHRDGREFPIEVSTTQLASEKGLVVTSAIRDITERKKVEHQISKLNKELEHRAMELETANKELEAFSYSVSHDLRSPLNNIDSFSQILMEDYANRLDAGGRDYVERLRASCQHMEDIIDALLLLSNTTRSELTIDNFDLTALAQAVAVDLKQKAPDRLVDWAIADGLTAEGDPQLLRVVLENLFGNAWKFTANRPRARIEFGALPQANGVRTYFVRDDGAGFDMTRAKKLFAPFNRLHDQNEFKGTGIGLATVQRVIHRHRGKIWAEGRVNQGAIFCFTLNGETETNGKYNHRA